MQRNTCLWSCGRIAAALGVAIWLAGCAIETSQGPGPSPQPTADRQQAPASRPLDPQQAQRLKAVMIPLLQKMDHPIPLNQVTITVMDDPHINAANAGGGEFYVTAGLLQKANDEQLAGVLGQEIAHADLGHVTKLQRIGTGANLATSDILPTPLAHQPRTNPRTGHDVQRNGNQRPADLLDAAPGVYDPGS